MQEISSEESKSLSTTPWPEITTSPPIQEQISFELILQCTRDLWAVEAMNIEMNIDSKLYVLGYKVGELVGKFYGHFHRLFLNEQKLTPNIKFELSDKFIARKDALEYYQAARRVFNELKKNNIHPKRVEASLAALMQAIGPTPEEEPKECEVIIECVSTTSLTVSDEVKPVRIIPKPEIDTPSPIQEQISFEFISQCHRDLIPASDRIPIGTNSKFDLLYDQASDLHLEFCSCFYDLFLKERKLTPDIEFDLTTKFITRKEALEYYQAAKRVFNELEKNGIRPEPVERSLAALRQAVGVTLAEEPKEPEINECTSMISNEVKLLSTTPEPKIGASPPGIFTFFKKKSINPNIFHAVWPIPISIMATYFVSAIYDASVGAHSIDSVNQFFGSKMKNAASFAEGLKTPGFIYGLATLMTVAFIGIYLYKKNKQVNVEESSLINDQTNNN